MKSCSGVTSRLFFRVEAEWWGRAIQLMTEQTWPADKCNDMRLNVLEKDFTVGEPMIKLLKPKLWKQVNDRVENAVKTTTGEPLNGAGFLLIVALPAACFPEASASGCVRVNLHFYHQLRLPLWLKLLWVWGKNRQTSPETSYRSRMHRWTDSECLRLVLIKSCIKDGWK